MTVAIPSKSVDSGTDVLSPLASLLQGINVLGTAPDTDTGAQVLEADATNIAKGWAIVVAAFGGLGAVGATIASFYNHADDPVRVAAFAGAGAVAVATILAVAYMVGADLKNRTRGAIVMYEVRKAITLQFLQEAVAASQTAQPAPPQPNQPVAAAAAAQGSQPAAADTVVVLASAGAQAEVLHEPDEKLGHLRGIRDKGKLEVEWVEDNGASHWCHPSHLNVQSYTY